MKTKMIKVKLPNWVEAVVLDEAKDESRGWDRDCEKRGHRECMLGGCKCACHANDSSEELM